MGGKSDTKNCTLPALAFSGPDVRQQIEATPQIIKTFGAHSLDVPQINQEYQHKHTKACRNQNYLCWRSFLTARTSHSPQAPTLFTVGTVPPVFDSTPRVRVPSSGLLNTFVSHNNHHGECQKNL